MTLPEGAIELTFIPSGRGELKEIPGIGPVIETSEENGQVICYPVKVSTEGTPAENGIDTVMTSLLAEDKQVLPSFSRFLLKPEESQEPKIKQENEPLKV